MLRSSFQVGTTEDTPSNASQEGDGVSLLNLDSYKPLVNQYGIIRQFCNRHIANVQPVQAYCQVCCEQLCIECILTNEHKGHHILSI
mmetsp:Transcript_4463/g.5951  ORF Transcript_4463/g.5951 Transcript_4463/m.5951 type:complete len:87 (-) Transcript_4463:118-378(-)